MIRKTILLLILIPVFAYAQEAAITDSQLVLRKTDSPLIAFRILFQVGSAHDPKGKEGLASLTASMLTEGSTTANEYQKILELLFPMAASYFSQTDKEMTVVIGVTHKDNVMPYYQLLREAVLSPAFKQEDFDRLKTDQLNYVAKTLRFNDDEELGKETLNSAIFRNHPYGHPNAGTVSGNQAITLQDVQDFYRNQYTRKNLVIGVAGNYPEEMVAQIKKDFAALPAGNESPKIPAPAKQQGWKLFIVEKKTPATAISFGFPLNFTRSNDDFFPMYMVGAWLGQHRTQFGQLYKVMREARGLNYGDYAYIEHFPLGGRTFQPRPNYARHHQIFEVWIRPVPNAVRHFSLRQAVREVQLLIDNGFSKRNFEDTKKFLINYMVSFAQSTSEQLGYALDDAFYRLPKPFLQLMRSKIESLKLEDVNQAIRRNLSTKDMTIAIVTEGAETFQKELVANSPSPIEYESPKPETIVEEDKQIVNYSVPVKAENVTIVPVDRMFE